MHIFLNLVLTIRIKGFIIVSRSVFSSETGDNISKAGEFEMRYICEVCGWIYDEAEGDPDNGIAAGTKFEDLPEDFVCPLCGVGKDQFSPEE